MSAIGMMDLICELCLGSPYHLPFAENIIPYVLVCSLQRVMKHTTLMDWCQGVSGFLKTSSLIW
jgi:hypothetical protein